MINRLPLLLFLIVFSVVPEIRAQDRNAVYFELGGSAIIPSFNYERRVNPRWTARAGFSVAVGYTEEDTDTTFVFPLTVSWLSHPERNHHFETGGGLTLAAGDRQDLWEDSDDEEKFSNLFVTGIVGYRYQKPAGGFQFRAVVTPVAGDGDILPWAGLSFGYVW